ncbi:MAG: hypothetical protein U1F49_04485 [Rubrivivax sp.]
MRNKRKSAGEATAAAVRSGRSAATALKDTVAHAGGAAMAVAGDLTELVAEASHNTLAINPLIGSTATTSPVRPSRC